MENVEKIDIEVAYAQPDSQIIIEVTVSQDTTIEEAIKHSGILDQYPEIDLAVNKVGVFGKQAKLASTMRAGERIEIYRALIADPKAVRKARAAEGKAMKKGGGDVNEKSTAADNANDKPADNIAGN